MLENKPVRFGRLACANIARKVSKGHKALTKRPPSRPSAAVRSTRPRSSCPRMASLTRLTSTAPTKPCLTRHLLKIVQQPVALNVSELDKILEACESNGVQYMDATMWMHHPRTAKMKEFLAEPERFGKLKSVHSIFSYDGGPDFLKTDNRVKPDLDALGRLGVIMTCGASLSWGDGKIATFSCSFLTNLTMDINCGGTKGNLRIHDFVIPFQENVGQFYAASKSKFAELALGCEPIPSEHAVMTDLPQEALMVSEFARLAANIERNGSKPEKKWPTISRKTQLALDAVKALIEKGFEPVEVGN
ncbi:hypothetical protein HYC85_006157 [Camellia sinensis]|uniref:Uncharacterized protein n=1 Tax=Camellia sinensis TaxID=4442 RepID=A0A7J7HM54_CAMSI|nr:hypothetical protein HYC85_006157 [Camellia sinensis]